VAVLLAFSAPEAAVAVDTFKPSTTLIHRIVTVQVNADGTATLTHDIARRADTPRGVSILGEEKLHFRETMTRMQVDEAWSVTPSGKRIDVPLDTVRIKDDTDEGEGDSDNKVATIIYPGLELGSVVHRRSTEVKHTSPFPGHFSKRLIAAPRIRVEHYEVNVVHPHSLPLKVQGDRFEGGKVVSKPDDPPGSVRYRFQIAHQNYWPAEGSELDFDDWAPSVMISTFPDYASLAAAYQRRAGPRAEPDDEVRRLAQSVTSGAGSDRERVARIRDWINRHIRYLSVHIGVEGWVPHPAPQVLRTRYGDCKDQSALMQAMLSAVGIESSAVLINAAATYQLPQVPESWVFDHVIVYIPSLDLFVDLTDRDPPLGSLPMPLYGKPGLLAATGQVVRLPVLSPERDFVETHVQMRIDDSGRVEGSVRAHIAGAWEGQSRYARQRAMSELQERTVNRMLTRYDESGVGRIWNSDPFVHGNPWVVQAEFDLESVVTLPGPSAMRIPVGLTRADLRHFANWKPLAERRNPFVCSAGRWRDDVEVVLPASSRPMFVPAGVAIEGGAFRYQSQWRLEGDRLRVVRELVIRRDRGYCVPQDERDFIPVREAMRRDLMAQVVFGAGTN
jgi:transglutaminase-like putative cysteine protease